MRDNGLREEVFVNLWEFDEKHRTVWYPLKKHLVETKKY
jgi:hypothetical protein